MKKLVKDIDVTPICKRLKELRINLGFKSAHAFAEALGISYTTYHGYEKSRIPQSDFLYLLADSYPHQADIVWLLTGYKENGQILKSTKLTRTDHLLGMTREILESDTDCGSYVTLKNVAVNGKVEKISSKNVIMYLQDLTGWNKTKIASDIFKISLSNLGNATREDRLDFYKIYEWASKNNIQLDFNELIGAHRTGQIGQAYSETPKIGAALSAHPKIGSTIQIKGETIPNTEINYLLNFTREILESDTDYAKSLDANIRSFHNAIETSSRLEKIETELSEMKQTIADLRKRDRRKGERRQNDSEPEIEKRTGTNRRTGT